MRILSLTLACLCGALRMAVAAEPLQGTKDIVLHARDGASVIIGTVAFTPRGAESAFAISFDDRKFTQYFLSMREFKCVEGADVLCHVPYPYANPRKVTPQDLSWLEHALIFLFKRPTDYGAKMANGIIYTLRVDGDRLVGTPQSIDLNEIATPPENLSLAYYGAQQRYDLDGAARWFASLTIEPRH